MATGSFLGGNRFDNNFYSISFNSGSVCKRINCRCSKRI